MKKTYQIPTTDIIKIETAQMIATSLGVSDKEAESGVMLGRGGSAWDDDEY